MAEGKKEGVLSHREDSPTAASAHNRLFKTSGVIAYKVMVATAMGLQSIEVDAATGDDAAEQALAKFPGAKVAHVEPAPKAE